MNPDVETADVAAWKDPSEEPPPTGKKLLLLTPYGVACLGHWNAEQFIGWAPLPRIPKRLKEKLL